MYSTTNHFLFLFTCCQFKQGIGRVRVITTDLFVVLILNDDFHSNQWAFISGEVYMILQRSEGLKGFFRVFSGGFQYFVFIVGVKHDNISISSQKQKVESRRVLEDCRLIVKYLNSTKPFREFRNIAVQAQITLVDILLVFEDDEPRDEGNAYVVLCIASSKDSDSFDRFLGNF